MAFIASARDGALAQEFHQGNVVIGWAVGQLQAGVAGGGVERGLEGAHVSMLLRLQEHIPLLLQKGWNQLLLPVVSTD